MRVASQARAAFGASCTTGARRSSSATMGERAGRHAGGRSATTNGGTSDHAATENEGERGAAASDVRVRLCSQVPPRATLFSMRLRRPTPALLVALVAIILLAFSRTAHADQPGAHTLPVAVLGFDAEDADDQADALTNAVRSRIRAAQGWALIETTQSLGMLTAALKCPSRPPPDCQQRIAEQLKTERFVWGVVAKSAANQVTAEVHLHQRNQPETVVKESFADNLKDSNDDALRKIAQQIVERLGASALGSIVVRGGTATGEVIIDGEKQLPLTNGSARIDVAAGSHAVELAFGPGPRTKRNVIVTAGHETVVDAAAVAAQPVENPPSEHGTSTRKIVGGALVAGGLAFGALSVQQWLAWSDTRDEGRKRADVVPQGQQPCDAQGDAKFCELDRDAKRQSIVAVASGALGVGLLGAGIYLLFTDDAPEGKPETKGAAPRPRFVPTAGRGTGGLMVVGGF